MSANLNIRRTGVRPAIAVTVGEPAGIGPEISIRAAWARRHEVNCVLLGDAAFLAMTAGDIDPRLNCRRCRCRRCATAACRISAPAGSA
jgi:4-hydroxythreonine-4-phosphate dehydrogenase